MKKRLSREVVALATVFAKRRAKKHAKKHTRRDPGAHKKKLAERRFAQAARKLYLDHPVQFHDEMKRAFESGLSEADYGRIMDAETKRTDKARGKSAARYSRRAKKWRREGRGNMRDPGAAKAYYVKKGFMDRGPFRSLERAHAWAKKNVSGFYSVYSTPVSESFSRWEEHLSPMRDPSSKGKVIAAKTFYSGELRILVQVIEGHHESPTERARQVKNCLGNYVYRVTLSPYGKREKHAKSVQYVCPPPSQSLPVDTAREMQNAAHAGMSFADHAGFPIDSYAAWTESGSGYHLARTKGGSYGKWKKS